MSTIRTSAAAAATLALGIGTFAGATPAHAAVCSKAPSVSCSKAYAKRITTTLTPGKQGRQVKDLQIALRQVRITVKINGRYDARMVQSVKAYQRSRGISATGNAGRQTLAALKAGKPSRTAAATVRKIAASSSSTRAQRAVNFASAQIGKPYRYGATGPSSYDCSGLTGAAWKAAGVSIPRTSGAQWRGLKKVSKSNLRPGDIVVFYGGGHVGLYVGNGYVIHAPRTGQNVKKVKMSTMGFTAAVRPAA